MTANAAPTEALPAFLRPFSSEVAEFCAQQELLPTLIETARIAHRTLEPAQPIEVELEHNPEGDDQWLAMNVVVRQYPEEFSRRYDTYLRERAATQPRDAASLVRLAYDVRGRE